MTVLTYPATSPYAATRQTSWCVGQFVFRPVPPDSADGLYELESRHTHRPDRLAYDLYGNGEYWWIFCERNPFLRSDPIWNFVAGLQIMVPSPDYLRRILGT